MRTREIFRYLVAMIIALSTSVNAMAQERNLKIYFNANNGTSSSPVRLVTDDHPNSAYDVPSGVTVSSEGIIWANKARYWEIFQQDVTDRLLADFVGNNKMESHLKLSFTDFPYEVNMIQWNVMTDLLSASITNILDNLQVTTKCIPQKGSGFSYTNEKWEMNFLRNNTTFRQRDIPWESDATLNGLTSFEISEKCFKKSPLGIILNKQTELDEKVRTFIKAGWNGQTGSNSNITDSDDENWAFKVKFTLPDIRMRSYKCTVDNNFNVTLGQIDNNIIVGERAKHALRGYIAAHAGAVVPIEAPTNPEDIDPNDFHYEYEADKNKINIHTYTGVIYEAKVAGDIPVTVKLMRPEIGPDGKFVKDENNELVQRLVSFYTQTIHVLEEDINRPEIAIGFVNGNKGYDITVGDEKAQIQGFFTKNGNGITLSNNDSGYHFEYSEDSKGEIIDIDHLTGKITAKKEGDVVISAVLKNGGTIRSNTYTYLLHVFAKHEGLEWQRDNIYTYTSGSNNSSWQPKNTNSSPRQWQASDYLNTKTTILENNHQQSSGSSTDSWKQIAWFTTDEFNYWRGVCQKIKMDVHVPKYSKATATYRFAGNVTIGEQKGSWATGHGCKYGFEVMDLGLVTSDQANSIIRNIKWNTTSSSETLSSSDNYTTIVRNGADNYTEFVGAGSNPNWETDNATGTTHISETRYLAVMAYLHRDHSYPGDFSVGYKDIPTYTYYSTITYKKNDETDDVWSGNGWNGTETLTSTNKTETKQMYNGQTKLPTRAGYEFLGWSTNPNATTAEYQGKGDSFCPYDSVNGGGKGPVSLYAVWRAIPYIVTLNHNYYPYETEEIVAYYGQPMPEDESIVAPTRTGYDFTGYRTQKDITPQVFYYDAEMKSAHIYDKTIDYTIFANWEAHTTKITFDFQGGNGSTTEVTATYGEAMPTEGVQAPQRQGYTFGGYYSKPNGAGTLYYTASMTSARTWNIDERLLDPQVTEVTLYAKWIKVLFTITLDADGGTLDYKEINTWGTILEKNANSLVLQVEKNESKCTDIWCSNRINIKPGYKLLGWYTEPQTEEDAHHHPALHPGTLVYSVDPGNNFSYHFRAVSEEANPKYWNSEKKWVGTDDLTLYAHYEMIFEVENDVITFLDSEPKNCVSGEDLTAALDYAKNHGAKLINTLDMTHPDTGADNKQGEDIMKAFEDAKAEAGSIVSPNALIYFTNTWPQNRKTNAITMRQNGGLCQDLVVTDRYSMRIPIEFNAQKASYARDAGIVDDETDQAKNSSWGTLCLPYAIKNKNSHVKLYWLESTANNYMEFEEFDDDAIIPANTPVLYCRTDGKVSSKINIVEANVNVPENADYTPVIIDYANPKKGTYPLESASATLQDWEFRGNLKTNIFYGARYVGEIEENAQRVDNGDVYYFKQNKFTHLTPAMTKMVNGKEVHYNAGKMTIYPYRAYFYKKGIGGSAKIASYSILVVDEFGNTTDITNAVFGDGEGDGKIYDLNGIRVMQPVKGRLYIVNCQKKVYR